MPEQNARLIALYQKQAKDYDQSGIHGLELWRREAVKRLHLKRDDLVVDIGCGTGLNFPWLQKAVGPQGRIIGVDLTDAMLEQARLRVAKEGWKNVELVPADAASYEFPAQVNGILSTFALTFIPQAKLVIQNGCRALAPGARWVVLDMAWPRAWPLWFTTCCSSCAYLAMASPGRLSDDAPGRPSGARCGSPWSRSSGSRSGWGSSIWLGGNSRSLLLDGTAVTGFGNSARRMASSAGRSRIRFRPARHPGRSSSTFRIRKPVPCSVCSSLLPCLFSCEIIFLSLPTSW